MEEPAQQHDVILGLGSNASDAVAKLRAACRELDKLGACTVSRLYRSEAVGPFSIAPCRRPTCPDNTACR